MRSLESNLGFILYQNKHNLNEINKNLSNHILRVNKKNAVVNERKITISFISNIILEAQKLCCWRIIIKISFKNFKGSHKIIEIL